MKKIVLSVLLSLSFFNLYAGTGVGDYEHSTEYLSSDVYVADYDGVDVKERPDENSRTIIHMPQGTYVRIVKVHGPSHEMDALYGDEYIHIETSWCAIFLPPDVRQGESQIGWIPSAEGCLWWEDNFYADKWKTLQLETYLLNSMWEVEYTPKSGGRSEYAVVEFDNNEIYGFEMAGGARSLELAHYEVTGGQDIRITSSDKIEKGVRHLTLTETSFSFEDKKYTYLFKKINLGSIPHMKIFKEAGPAGTMGPGIIFERSRKYFRMYSRDYYNNKNIAEYVLNSSSDKREVERRRMLASIATAYGISIEAPYYEKMFDDYWRPHLETCEKTLDEDNCYYNKFEDDEIGTYFVRKHSYMVKERLKLRSSEGVNSSVIGIMEKGTFVRFIECGNIEYINGVVSVWVKVRILWTPEGISEKQLPEGTTGYCFGAYLGEGG